MNAAERAPIAMIRADRDGRVLWQNPAAATLMAAWRTKVGERLPPSECDRIALVAANGIDTQLDLVVREQAWGLHYCPDADGTEVLIVATDRRRESEVVSRLLVADRAPVLHPDPILRVTRQGVIAWANAAAAPVLAHWNRTIGDALPTEWSRTIAAVAAEGVAHRDVLEHRAGVWSLQLVPDVDGSAVYLFAQDRVRASQGDPEQAQDNFVANMGHELRTPLNAIFGYAELVQDDLQSRGLDESVADLEKIRESAAKLRELIDGMVDLAKLQAGRTKLQPSAFYVGDLLDDVAVQASSKAERTGNNLSVQIDADPGDLEADPRRLRQILEQLLDNACKFTENGQISIRVENAEHEGQPAIAFRVSDTGIGLSATELARLFRPYSQGDNSATRRYGGSGLGLAIARMLARRMGGDVTVRSESGRGSTFTLVLPKVAPR